MSNVYTNKMRYAIRTLKNPAPIDVFIKQHEEYIELAIDKQEFDKLPTSKRLDFMAYVYDMQNVLESEGATVRVPRFL